MSTTLPLLSNVETIEELQKKISTNNLKIEVIGKKINYLQKSLEMEFSNGSS